MIAAGALTLAVPHFPLIWIGGFLVGGSLIINGFRQWFNVLSIDAQDMKGKEQREVPHDDAKSVVITCGKCYTRIRVKRGKGVTTVWCPGCQTERRVMA